MEPITLTTDRLRLRNFVPEDADAVYAICQDPSIRRWTVVPDPYTRQDAEFFLNRLVPDGWREDTDYLRRRTAGRMARCSPPSP